MKTSKNNDLTHFGILGMKWGVRKDDPETQQRKADKDLDKAGKKALSLAGKKYIEVYNAMADESQSFYSDVNSKFHEKYGKDFNLIDNNKPEVTREYFQACADAATNSLQKHSDRIIGPQVDPRVKITWYLPTPESFPSFYVERVNSDVEHADEEADRILLEVIRDGRGFIIQLVIPTTSTGELMHYGVMGMRWGVRKTDSGDSGIKKDRKTALKNRRSLSDAELDTRINRLQKEKRFKDLQEDDINPGRQATKQFVGKYGGIALGSMAGIVGAKLAKIVIKNNSDIFDAIATKLVKLPTTIIGG